MNTRVTREISPLRIFSLVLELWRSGLTVETRRQCCFFKTNTGNAVAVLLFQIQHWKRRSSVAFSNPTLETPQQRCFFKSNTGNAVAALLFQIHHWKRGSSAASLNPRYGRMWGISTPVPRKFQGIEHDGLQRFGYSRLHFDREWPAEILRKLISGLAV